MSTSEFVDATANAANPYHPEVAADPVPFYDALRAHAPAATMLGLDGVHIISRYEDVKFALQHPEIFSSEIATIDIGQERPLIPLQIDPPEHAKYRRVMDPQLAHRHVAPLEADVRNLVNELIDGFAGRGSCDAHAELTVPLPCTVFLQMCNLPLDELDRFLGWKDDIIRPHVRHPEAGFGGESTTPYRHAAAAEVYEFFDDVIADRRANPGDDLFSRFAQAEVDGDRMTHDQMLDAGLLFILAGLDTVTSTLDCAIAHLGRDTALRDALAADPGRIPDAIEELLRLHTPVMQVMRTVAQPFTLHGVEMSPGDTAMVMLGAADTDPGEFGATAQEFELGREANRHLAFGGGPHRCMGSHLARFELAIVLEELHRRLPDFTVPDGTELNYSPGIREIEHLPLVFTAAS